MNSSIPNTKGGSSELLMTPAPGGPTLLVSWASTLTDTATDTHTTHTQNLKFLKKRVKVGSSLFLAVYVIEKQVPKN